jgi:phage-related protein
MYKHYLNFTKNGINSRDMGVTHVSLDSGLFDEGIGANRTIIEQQNNQTDRRYFKRISLDPIEFEMALLLDDDMTDAQIKDIFKWLLNDYYEELFFEDEADRIYYCIPISQPRIVHNGMNQGYIVIQMRTYDGYLYSREIIRTFDFTANTAEGMNFSLHNEGDEEIYPFITITFGESSVGITNLVTNETTWFTGILLNEIITLDNEKQEISTNAGFGVYRHDNHNDMFMRIIKGTNNYKIVGKCTLEVKYRYKSKF